MPNKNTKIMIINAIAPGFAAVSSIFLLTTGNNVVSTLAVAVGTLGLTVSSTSLLCAIHAAKNEMLIKNAKRPNNIVKNNIFDKSIS